MDAPTYPFASSWPWTFHPLPASLWHKIGIRYVTDWRIHRHGARNLRPQGNKGSGRRVGGHANSHGNIGEDMVIIRRVGGVHKINAIGTDSEMRLRRRSQNVLRTLRDLLPVGCQVFSEIFTNVARLEGPGNNLSTAFFCELFLPRWRGESVHEEHRTGALFGLIPSWQ